MKKVAMLFLIMFLVSCTDEKEATRVLEAQGYTNIQITGYSYFGCDKHDTYHTGFVATGLNGKEIKGTVCSGLLFKGSTIRF